MTPAPKEAATQALADLFGIARHLSSTLDLDLLLVRIGEAAKTLTGGQGSSILLVDETGQNLFFKVATGEKSGVLKKIVLPITHGIAGWCARERKPVRVADVGKDPRFTGEVDRASGFQTKSLLAVPMEMGEELVGVCEVVNKRGGSFTEDDEKVLSSLAGLAAVAVTNAKLVQQQKNFFANVLEILIHAAETRQTEGVGHAERVARLSTAIGRRMGVSGEDYKTLHYGALLHDIGWLGSRTRALSDRELQAAHPALGAEIIRGIQILKPCVPVVLHHHERADGTGFPAGLSGKQIPLLARIVACAEGVEEMRLAGFDLERLRQMLRMESGTRFDPEVAQVCLEVLSPQEVQPVGGPAGR